MEKLTSNEELCLIFAARYAHGRQSIAAHIVVAEILKKWEGISDNRKAQLKREAEISAAANIDDWQRLIDHD